ncbi:Hypothetical predicted protein [Mytilus galloprovincialis]|nr:Hypothetical predicted protein [Mytilus galloprovincialis]
MDIFPKITRDLVHDIINPTELFHLLQNSYIRNTFTERENNMVESLVSNGYNECDVDFIYKIVWQYLPKPRCGWQTFPENSDLSVGDDLQRIYLRSKLFYSRPRVEILGEEFAAWFKEFKDVAKRIDIFLHKQADETYLCKISNIESNKFDESYIETCIEKARQIENMQVGRTCRSNETSINLYIGRSGRKCIDRIIKEGSKVEMMNLIVTGEIKGNEVGEKFLRVNSSENLFQTEIEDIQPNRIVLIMKVKAQTLQSKDQFMEKMLKLLVKVLIPKEENQFPNSTIDTVIIGFADRITLENPPSQEELVKYAQRAEGYNLFLSVSLNRKFDLKSQDDGYLDLSDCTILSTKMVFTDSKGLLIYDTTIDATDYIPLSEKPRYVTEIDNETVAVSSDWDWDIRIISLTTKEVSRTIQTSVNHGKLFYTAESILYCCDLNGKIQWQFSDDKHSCLLGVTSDGNGNAFVSCLSAHAVLLVLSGGKKYREILNRSSGLTLPRGIHFAKHDNLLLVCNKTGKVSIVDAR